MTTATIPAHRAELARRAASAALTVLPASSPLSPGDPGPLPATAPAGQAVTAKFGGATGGEAVIVVAQDLADALRNSPLGELDLAKALTPALEAAIGVLGPVVMEPAQVMPATVVLGSLAAKGDAVYVPLLDGDQAQAAVALVATPWPAPPSTAQYRPGNGGRAGLDLLQDVEMEVSAELGRTRMSVRELVSLSPGAVVELDRAAGSPADLLVNGRLIARGEVVVVDENFGIRITEIVPPGAETT
jgi:flagellar motor switch protein FliN